MKRIKLCIVGILLSGTMYGHGNDTLTTTEKGIQVVKILNLIEKIQTDMYYGHLPYDKGNYYINTLVSILPKPIDSWCENCDEID